MSKKILALDSQFLGRFQQCEMNYKYSALVQIEPSWRRHALNIGLVWARLMEIFYRAKMKYKQRWVLSGAYDVKMNRLLKRFRNVLIEGLNTGDVFLDDEERHLLASRIVMYEKFYRNETWIPLAMESGFSFILYEDDNHLFIYEGRPDLVVMMPDPLSPARQVRVVVDHKTAGRREDLVDFNNQVNGYLCAADTRYFVYNYCGKQKDPNPSKYFWRQIVSRSPEALEKWKKNTIEWYFRIAKAIDDDKFTQSMQCSGKYGPCEFISLCAADDTIGYNGAMQSNFKRKEQAWKAW